MVKQATAAAGRTPESKHLLATITRLLAKEEKNLVSLLLLPVYATDST